MISNELQHWIHVQSKKLVVKYGNLSQTHRERVYARALKLNEEVGELCAEVLASNNDQRQDKIAARHEESLSHEFADVLICTLLLAEVMEVDIDHALRSKIKKIDARFADVVITS